MHIAHRFVLVKARIFIFLLENMHYKFHLFLTKYKVSIEKMQDSWKTDLFFVSTVAKLIAIREQLFLILVPGGRIFDRGMKLFSIILWGT